MGAGVLIALAALLVFTFDAWMPLGIKWALRFKGFQTDSVARDGDRLIVKGLTGKTDGIEVRAASITTFTPDAWQKLLRLPATNEAPVFMLIEGWKVTLPIRKATEPKEAPPVYERIVQFENAAAKWQTNLPRAQMLNGVLNAAGKEFRFGVIEWNGGVLSSDFTWPGLNDPAELKLDASKLPAWQLTVRQIALEIGARIRGNRTNDLATIEGYARWGTNRIDFATGFGPKDVAPRTAMFESKGLGLEGKLLKIPELERLDARFRMVITNERFDLRIGAPVAAE